MAVSYKVFDAATSTGDQTISSITGTDGSPFTPVAALFWTSLSVTASGFADSGYWCSGFTDGTRQACRGSYLNHDNLTIQFIGTHSLQNETYAENSIIYLKRWVSGIPNSVPVWADIRASIVSFASGSCTINWSTAHTAAFKVHALFLGGTGVEAYCSAFAAPSSAGAQSQSVAGVGFTPSTMFTMAPITTSTNYWRYGSDLDGARQSAFGFVDNNLNQRLTMGYLIAYYSEGATGFYNMSRGVCWQTYGLGRIFGVTFEMIASLSSYNADGFGVSWGYLSAGYVNVRCPYLAIKGLETWTGSEFHPTTTGLEQYTSSGFEADAVILQGCGRNQLASATSQGAQFAVCVGAATKLLVQGCTWAGEKYGANPTRTAKGERATTAVYLTAEAAATGASTTPLSEFTYTQSLPTGFELNASVVDGSAREFFPMVIGATADIEPPVEPPTPEDVDINWRLHRFDMKPRDEQTS